MKKLCIDNILYHDEIGENFLSHEQIKEIREQYRLSRESFYPAIGLSIITEEDSPLEMATNNLLLLLETPENFVKIYKRMKPFLCKYIIEEVETSLTELGLL